MTNPISVSVTKVPLIEIASGKLARFSLSVYGVSSLSELGSAVLRTIYKRGWLDTYMPYLAGAELVSISDLAPPQITRDVLPKRTRDEITHRSSPIKASIWR